VIFDIRIAASALTEILESTMEDNAVNIPLNSSWKNMLIKVNESPDRFASLDDIVCYKFTPKSSGTVEWYFGIDGVAAKVVDGQMNMRYADVEYAYVDGNRQEYVYSLDVQAGEVYYFIPYNDVDADSGVTSAMLHIEMSNRT